MSLTSNITHKYLSAYTIPKRLIPLNYLQKFKLHLIKYSKLLKLNFVNLVVKKYMLKQTEWENIDFTIEYVLLLFSMRVITIKSKL